MKSCVFNTLKIKVFNILYEIIFNFSIFSKTFYLIFVVKKEQTHVIIYSSKSSSSYNASSTNFNKKYPPSTFQIFIKKTKNKSKVKKSKNKKVIVL